MQPRSVAHHSVPPAGALAALLQQRALDGQEVYVLFKPAAGPRDDQVQHNEDEQRLARVLHQVAERLRLLDGESDAPVLDERVLRPRSVQAVDQLACERAWARRRRLRQRARRARRRSAGEAAGGAP